jgi:hypothetical protein
MVGDIARIAFTRAPKNRFAGSKILDLLGAHTNMNLLIEFVNMSEANADRDNAFYFKS